MSSIHLRVDLFYFKRLIACATSERCTGSVKHRGASAWESFTGWFSQIFSTFPFTGFSSASKLFFHLLSTSPVSEDILPSSRVTSMGINFLLSCPIPISPISFQNKCGFVVSKFSISTCLWSVYARLERCTSRLNNFRFSMKRFRKPLRSVRELLLSMDFSASHWPFHNSVRRVVHQGFLVFRFRFELPDFTIIGSKLAFTLCIRGNDFVPKLYSKSHDTVCKTVLENTFRNSLYSVDNGRFSLNKDVYIELVKYVLTPKRKQGSYIPYEEVRAISIAKTKDKSKKSGNKHTDPRKWLPPQSAIARLGDLIQLQIEYLQTAGVHECRMPNFLGCKCFRENTSGET